MLFPLCLEPIQSRFFSLTTPQDAYQAQQHSLVAKFDGSILILTSLDPASAFDLLIISFTVKYFLHSTSRILHFICFFFAFSLQASCWLLLIMMNFHHWDSLEIFWLDLFFFQYIHLFLIYSS